MDTTTTKMIDMLAAMVIVTFVVFQCICGSVGVAIGYWVLK
jgi:hypothetical protein